jgi:hypothetical protein
VAAWWVALAITTSGEIHKSRVWSSALCVGGHGL